MESVNVCKERSGLGWRALLVFAGLAAVVLWGMSGCSGRETAPSEKTEIAGIVFQEDQFFRLVEYGMKEASKKFNVELYLGNSFGSLDKEISLIDTYLAKKVDAIVVAPLSIKASIPALRRAHDRGIKVVTFDGYIDADFPVSSVKSDQVALGTSTGIAARKYIEEKLNGKAKLAMVEYISLAPEPGGMRVKGFRDEIAGLPGVECVAEQDAWLASQAVDVVDSILTAHPDINLIWAANEGGTVGAVTAVRNSGKAGQVVVFGTDMSEQMADFLLAGDNVLQAVTGQKPFDIGFRAIEIAVKALAGEPVEKNVSLPGILFTREKPDEVREYKAYLQKITQ